MAVASSSVAGESSVNWKLAVVVGVPVAAAVGVGYWYYTHNSNDKNVPPSPSAKTAPPLTAEPKVEVQKPVHKAVALKEKGNKYFKGGKYEESRRCYQEAIDMSSDVDNATLATLYQNRAAANEMLKDFENVKKDCTMALTLNPQYTKALLRRAKAYEALQDLSKALVDVTAACILENFQSQSTLATADRILKELGRQQAKKAISNWRPVIPSVYFIKTYFSSFSKDPIRSFIEDETPKDYSRGFMKAIKSLQNGEYESIVSSCAEELNQTEAEASYKNEALLLRGTMNILTRQTGAAMADLEAVIENNDASLALRVNALLKRASVWLQLEEPASCMKDFDRAVSLDPDNTDIYHQRGQMNLLMEKFEEAQKNFSLAVKLNPKNPITLVQMKYTEYRLYITQKNEQKLIEVMADFEKYIREYPTCAECFTLYAQVLSDQQQCEKADQLYEKAMELDPSNASLLVHRAILCLQWTGDVEKAVSLIKKALDLDEKCGFACETLGTIQVQRGHLKEAIEMFDKAIEFAKSELELAHLYSLRDASVAQQAVFQEMNLTVPSFGV